MKFWLVDVGFYYPTLSRPKQFYGLVGTLGMWVFITLFLVNSLPFRVNSTLTLIFYFGINFLLLLSTYCQIRRKHYLTIVSLDHFEESDKEMLTSNKSLPHTDLARKKADCSLNSNADFNGKALKARGSINVLCGGFLTITTFTTHSFVYAYILLQDVQHTYHLILTICVAFPVTLCLICISMMSGNILYNLWVDREFAREYLQKQDFKKILPSIYFRIGILFVRVAFTASLFTSFCGVIGGDGVSVIVFAILVSIVMMSGLVVGGAHYWPIIRRRVFNMNSV